MAIRNDRTGEIGKNTYGSTMVIDKYINSANVVVRFIETNYTVIAKYRNFNNGLIKHPYDKTMYGIGFIGEGEYKPAINKKHTKVYTAWMNMFKRCYSEKFHITDTTYKDCIVCDEWHNFQNFAKWYDENYYEVDGERMELDKDMLIKGNKTYSPETCVFVPKELNLLFGRNNAKRGELPLGVYYNFERSKYQAHMKNDKNEYKYLGSFDTPEDAFRKYKGCKEIVINKKAEKYKENIPERLYLALKNYEIEITD